MNSNERMQGQRVTPWFCSVVTNASTELNEVISAT